MQKFSQPYLRKLTNPVFKLQQGPWNTCSSLLWGWICACHVTSLNTQPKCPGWARRFCGPTWAFSWGLWSSEACCVFNKHEEKYVSSEETLKKEINVGALNFPLVRTVDPISLFLTQKAFRKLSLSLFLLHLKLGKVHWGPRKKLVPTKSCYNTAHQ